MKTKTFKLYINIPFILVGMLISVKKTYLFYLFIYLLIYLFTYLSIYLRIYLFTHAFSY